MSIQSDVENDYAARVLRAPSISKLYIGAYVGGGTWKWADNRKFAYSNFKGQVTTDPDDVASMILSAGSFAQWDILSTTYLFKPQPFACQVPACPYTQSDQLVRRELPGAPSYNDVTAVYYFGSSAVMISYSDAEEQCRKIGGHLPSISNAYQNAQVQDAAYKILGKNAGGGKLILGFSNLMANGFSWSDGTISKYTNWAMGEPVTVVAGVAWMDLLTGVWNTAAPFAISNYICALPVYRGPC